MRGIAVIRPGATTGDIGAAIQSFVEAQHMSVVRDFCGHGLGRLFHDEPNIVHVGRPGEGIVLKPGMFFTVEPMINLGRPHVKVLSDGWTAVTRDRSLSAQFEHTVGVTETGVEVFTISPAGLRQAALYTGRVNPRHRHSSIAIAAELTSRAGAKRCGASLHGGKGRQDDGEDRPRRGVAALSRPSRAAARALPRGRHRCGQRLRAARAGAVPRHPAARRQAAGQGPDRQVRLLRRGGGGAAGAAARGQGPRRSAPSPSSRSCTRRRAGWRAAR